MNKERKLMLIIVGIMLAALWSAPPAPGSRWQKDMSFNGVTETYSHFNNDRDRDLPENILVLPLPESGVSNLFSRMG